MVKVSVVGAGYVGLCTGVVFAKHGHEVTVVDVVPEKLKAVREGRAPFYEPGVDEALKEAQSAGRLHATEDLAEAVRNTDLTFLCVGTPQGEGGAIDLTYIRQASLDIGKAIREKGGYHVVVVKSTVVPGTAETVVQPAVAEGSGKTPGAGFAVASNPEFLKEGSAMKDALEPDRIVVGASDEKSAGVVWSLYGKFDCPKLTTTPATAEMIKYASNAFLAVKIAFSNEMANVCERLGMDWYEVAEGVGHDARIGSLFLRAGVGFGGSCFPKDVAAIAHVARDAGVPSGILGATLENNERQPEVAVRLLAEELGDLAGKRVALLGLAFKPDTDDVRESRALPILRALEKAGASVAAYDPEAMDTFRAFAPDYEAAKTLEDALKGADGCIVQTEWRVFREFPPGRFTDLMRVPVVVDGRRTFDPARMKEAGVRYRAVGYGKK